jgi:hypothetical protein
MRAVRGLLGLLAITGSLATSLAFAQGSGVVIGDPAQLRDLIAGNTLFGANTKDGVVEFKWSEYHCANGRSIYVRGLDILRGKWWLEGSEVCYSYNDLDPAAHFCFQFQPRGDGGYDLISRGNAPLDSAEVTVLGQVAGDPFKIQNLVGGTCGELSS